MDFSRSLLMCLLLPEIVVVSHAEFNRLYTGVTFSPYVKNSVGKGSFPSFGSYSTDDIKVMLEVVSTKFSRILTYSVGGTRDSYNEGPYLYNNLAFSKTAEVAAHLNNARGNKSLAVYIGIEEQGWEENTESAAETAFFTRLDANGIYEGTVEGFVLFPNSQTLESLSSATSMIYELREHENELKIGVRLACHDSITADHSRYDRLAQERRDLIELSDFIVCSVDPEFGDGDVRTYAMSAFSKISKFKKQAKDIKSSIEVMGETYWPSDGSESWLNTKNLRDYWIEIDRLASESNIHVWLREAFDNPWRKGKSYHHEHAGWWKLTQNSLVRNTVGYVEKVSVYQDLSDENRVSFGEFCNKTTRCNSRASLLCVNGTCECMKNEMIYDVNKEQCVVLSGERCTYTAIEILTDQTREKRYSERLACVENATCNSDGYCGCRSDSFETFEGLCALKKRYLSNCTRNVECQETHNLICAQGTCLCNATESIYDEGYGECIGKVGAGKKYPACVKHANFECKDFGLNCNLCQCSSGYIASNDGFCYADYGTPCSPSQSPCLENYMCENEECTCHFPAHQEYIGGKCISKINGPCFQLETVHGKTHTYDCIEDAECRNDEGISECLCKKGYIQSSEGVCRKAFGTPCSRDVECDQVPGANLTCRSGFCSCGDFKTYDEQLSQCLGLVGAKCDKANECIPNAFCKENRDKTMEGSCRCITGTTVNTKRRCVLHILNANEKETEYAADEATATEFVANID